MTKLTYKSTALILLSLVAFICSIHCYPLTAKSALAISTPILENLVSIIERDEEEEKKYKPDAWTKDPNENDKDKRHGEPTSDKGGNPDDDVDNNNTNHDNDNNDDNKYNGVSSSSHSSSSHSSSSHSSSSSKNNHSKTPEPTATNTVVTTIVVIATESPTTIYSDTDTNPSKQKGDASSDNQVSDPNATASATNTSASSLASAESSRAAEGAAQGRSNYRKIVLALSIVGSVAGVIIAVGLFVLTRHLRKRKQKAQQAKIDEESRDDSNNNNSNFSSSLPSSQVTPLPPPSTQPLSNNNNTTLIENRLVDTSETPSAPLSDDVDPRTYAEYRQNRTLSMFSQTTATVAPSAPTAKELDAMNHDNPFEDEFNNSSSAYRPHHPALESTSSIHLPQTSRSILQQHHNFPPPPAYTPSAIPTVIPTAPPLYALPITETEENSSSSSRRHSISSCSDIQATRPPSVRRGSGTLTLITS